MARSTFARFFYRLIDKLFCVSLRILPAMRMSEYIALWWGYRYRPNPSVVRLRSGALLQLNRADHLQLILYYLGTFEPHCLRLLRPCLDAGAVFVDVGANIGLYSIEAARIVGASGRVISVEAAPHHVSVLRKSIDLNDLKNVVICETAVSNFSGDAVLARAAGQNAGSFTLNSIQSAESYKVNVTTLDEIVATCGLERLDLIKMDIEGSEYNALAGASATIERFFPTILIEINEAALKGAGTSSVQLIEKLGSLGYLGWRVARSGSSSPIGADDCFECEECIFVHRDRSPVIDRLSLVSGGT